MQPTVGPGGTEPDHFKRGLERQQSGDLDGAIEEYRAGLRLDPDNFAVRYNLGLLFERKGDLDAAIAEYRITLLLKPDFVPAHGNLGSPSRTGVIWKEQSLNSTL